MLAIDRNVGIWISGSFDYYRLSKINVCLNCRDYGLNSMIYGTRFVESSSPLVLQPTLSQGKFISRVKGFAGADSCTDRATVSMSYR